MPKLPPQPTPFVGRERELAELLALLADPACRLLTITGPGGIGKTRLAMELARRLAESGEVAFVPLETLAAPDGIAAAVAAAAGVSLTGDADARAQLLEWARERRATLVLDNFEQLLEGAGLLAELCAGAAGPRLLVTSREALNLQDEWLYALDGLDLPGEEPAAGPPVASVELFVERARRVRPDFALEAERAGVFRICRLVEGMPLALELAAAWTRILPCAEIADEIARGMDLLATRLRDMPPRHRSVRLAFDRSVELLGDDERGLLARLSVFQGGFTHHAASVVAGASIPSLAALVEKSLVRLGPDGRYRMHALLRQYAEGLLERPAEAADVRRSHAAYYAQQLRERLAPLIGAGQVAALATIGAEIDNIRSAWRHAAETRDVPALAAAAHPLALYHLYRGPYGEGAALLEQGVASLRREELTPRAGVALAVMLNDVAWLSLRLGQLDRARACWEESLALHERFGVPPQPGRATDPLLGLADLALSAGSYAEATRLGEAALRRSEVYQHIQNLPFAWYILAEGALAQGLYGAARHYARQSHAAVRVSGDRWYLAYVLHELGHVAVALGAFDEARRSYEESYALREEFGDVQGMAEALDHMGRAALRAGEYASALELYGRSLERYRATGDLGGTARALNGLGVASLAAGDLEASARAFHEALGHAATIGLVPLSLHILGNACELLIHASMELAAVEILVSLLRNPASERGVGDHAQRLLVVAEEQLAPGEFAAAAGRGQSIEMDSAVARVRAALAAPGRATAKAAPQTRLYSPLAQRPPAAGASAASEALIEPLTERDREVLALVAAGLSNQEIADRLVLALGTVKWYVREVCGKLGVRTRTQAIARAREIGLLP
jgi:predicted ATPase/DNA-binding CsgD family transcriptional regulator